MCDYVSRARGTVTMLLHRKLLSISSRAPPVTDPLKLSRKPADSIQREVLLETVIQTVTISFAFFLLR